MQLLSKLPFWASLILTVVAIPNNLPPQETQWLGNVTIFQPPASWASQSTSYARVLLLDKHCETSNVLLTTWTQSPPGEVYFPVYKSIDGGRSWEELSRIYFNETKSGGALFQPFLYELPIQVDEFPPGTILATGNAIPGDFSSTNIDIYASTDIGKSWKYVSNVARGTAPNTTNGAHPIWEPFINTYDGQVVVYYSDQRDPLHGQKLAHQTSRNLMDWGPVVNDVALANYTLRPGMTTVAKMGNDKWILTHELGLAPNPTAPYAVHYRIADSPLEFQTAPEYLLQATDGTISSAGPYVVWTPAGGPNGTIVVSDSTYSELFLNTGYGDPNTWVKVPTGKGISYTRALQVLPDESIVMIVDGGIYGGTNTSVTLGDFAVPGPRSKKDTLSSCNKGH